MSELVGVCRSVVVVKAQSEAEMSGVNACKTTPRKVGFVISESRSLA